MPEDSADRLQSRSPREAIDSTSSISLASFADVAHALAAAREVPEVMEHVARSAIELTRAQGAYVEQIFDAEGTVEVVTAVGKGPPPLGTRIPYPGSLTEEIMAEAEPGVLTEIERIGKSVAPYLHRSCAACAALVVPLVSEGDVLGTLVLLRSRAEPDFDAREIAEVRTLGDLASVSLRRVLSRQETDRERQQLETLLQSTGEGIYGIDIEGRCTFLNRAGSEMLGYPPEEVLGKDMHALIHHSHPDGSSYPRDECPIFRAFRIGDSIRSDDEVIWRKDGTAFPAEYGAYPIRRGEEVRGAVVTFRDVTERKKAEGERRQLLIAEREVRERAEEALRMRDEVLGVVSHDLRNPLSTIMLSTSLLVDTPLKEEQREKQLEIIQRSAERALRLIEDLLDVARIETGRLSVDCNPVRVSAVVHQACEALRPLAEKKSQELGCELPDGLPPVNADADRLHQVLSNLAGNAIKFTEEGGRITIRARSADGSVEFSVSDTGPGIADKDLPKLFGRYWQAKQTAHMGAGFGLTISRGIVEAHGGRIWAESELGVGTTFYFTVPPAETEVPCG